VAARILSGRQDAVVANRRGKQREHLRFGSLPIRLPSLPPIRANRLRGCAAHRTRHSSDSSKAFVACSAGHQIMAIRLARSEALRGCGLVRPSLSRSTRPLEALLDVGQGPVQLALKPDGGETF